MKDIDYINSMHKMLQSSIVVHVHARLLHLCILFEHVA